jgi:DNA invertase Pin-like site-specific DNA recombinase/predicted DNA-binding transcriptional regulator AlpA
MNEMGKIDVSHRRRQAVVYVRQSSVAQVRNNTESLERQYELVRRAVELGWDAAQVVVVDEDLGRSGAEATARSGFQSLVASVGLGKVGLILGIEVSRLARNSADWYQLLDLCAVCDTLIADNDGVYHPGDFSDRLVLGLKGTMSEAELHLLRGRLTAGIRHKAAKGQLRVPLPVGYEYDGDDEVVLCCDDAVRVAVTGVFARFAELGSVNQVLKSFHQDGIDLPRGRPGKHLEWAPPSLGFLYKMLTNPCYAGAFVFGRSKVTRRVGEGGKAGRRIRPLPREEWSVVIGDHHPGYISWETYEANVARLAANRTMPGGEGGGAPREGSALLQGLLRCGVCGRMMRVGYTGRPPAPGSASPGRASRYVCLTGEAWAESGKCCQALGGRTIEAAVVAEAFAALEPARLAATAVALTQADTARAQRLEVFETAVQRTRYEAERARRQYQTCEPENRLVARNLEVEWEQRLRAAAQAAAALAAEQARQPATLSADELDWLAHAGADLKAVFEAPTTTSRERKQLLRALLCEITLTVNREQRHADLVLHWEGGATSEIRAPLPRMGAPWRTTDIDTVELVRRLAAHYDDATIALVLNRQRRRTGSGLAFTKDRVTQVRKAHRISGHPQMVTPSDHNDDVVSISVAAKTLGVSVSTVYRWLESGFIAGDQLTPGAPWRIRLDDDLKAKVADDAPEGWLPLNQAAVALGVARQTVLHKVQRGEIPAVHIRKGRRSGLRIQVKQPPVGLFEKPKEEMAQC